MEQFSGELPDSWKPLESPLPIGNIWPDTGGEFSQEVVGESFYQEALDLIAGGRDEHGADLIVDVRLVPDPHNPYDANAVRVEVRGHLVGHLDRETARRFQKECLALFGSVCECACAGKIRGGWYHDERDQGSFGIYLDVRI